MLYEARSIIGLAENQRERSPQILSDDRAKAVTTAIIETQRWIDSVVVDLNLCPFAKRELERGSVRFVVCEGDEEAVLLTLHSELELLQREEAIETTLIVHPCALSDFLDYNDFLGVADSLLSELGLEGVFQIASFHPDYQFAHTSPRDPENYSNRSPYPMLHLLRESSVSRAVALHPDVNAVPDNNIATLKALGTSALDDLLQGVRSGER